MNINNNKTKSVKQSEVERQWHIFDAKGQVLGRMAVEIAKLLIGKGKPNYTPHVDMGDYVVVTNASEVMVTGRKPKQKKYYRFTGYIGNMKEATFEQVMEKNPTKVIRMAVSGMLPKNKLKDNRLKNLKIFAGDNHPYADKFQEKK
jgi:large subunit ribosomal protein L13